MRRFAYRGFTLIELLIVVGIIAILAAIAIPNLLEAQTRSKVARAKADIRSVVCAVESYAVDNNKYPLNYDAGNYVTPQPISEYLTFASLTTPTSYMTSAPSDPFRPDVKEMPRGHYYEWVGADTVLSQDTYTPELKQYWAKTGTQWFLGCIGPDRTNDVLGHHLDQPFAYLYDPTNGTVSSGDLGRTNRGPIPSS